MSLIERCRTLAQGGNVEQAYVALTDAAAEGDGEAASEIGHWRVMGDLIRRDLDDARERFRTAVDFGFQPAHESLMALMAHGMGQDRRRWEEALDQLELAARSARKPDQHLALISAMQLDANGDPTREFEPRFLCPDPLIVAFTEFMTPCECTALRQLATPQLAPALVVHPETGALMADPVRNSRTAAFPLLVEGPFLHAINRRIAAASHSSAEQGEPTQILAYQRGQEYKLHSDAINGEANQRIQTFLVALNDDFDGGETYFPEVGLRLRYRQGDAICFSNVNADMAPSRSAVHAGLPVIKGEKFLLSKWIRQAPLDLQGSPGRPF